MTGRIRVGVVLDGTRIPAWQRLLLEELGTDHRASVEVLVVAPRADAARQVGHYGLYRWYVRRDARQARVSSDALAPGELPDFLQRVARAGAEAGGDEAVAALAGHDLDVVLVLGDTTGIERLAGAARCGAWYYDHGPARCTDGETAGFWEVLERQPAIYACLRARDAGGAERLLYESWSPVDRLSHARSRSRHLWKAAHFLPRALRRLHALGAEAFLAEAGVREAPAPAKHRPPTTARLLLPFAGYVAWRAWRKLELRLWRDRWTLMHGESRRRDFAAYRKLRPPAGRFWADPHVLRRDGRDWVFFEDASLESWQGRIAVFPLDGGGEASPPVIVIERPYHLSYPFLLEWQGELWLIPESGENRTVEAWRCRRFPHEWEFSHNLMSGRSLYDATLLPHDGRWWLFGTVKAHDAASSWDELCVFYAEEPLATEWRPHPLNPVVSDVRRARPAGPFLRRDGRLYRPSQNSSHRYGYALNFNEVLELTPESYRECLAEELLPDFDRRFHGVHSWSESGEVAVIDALERIRRS